MAQYIIKTTRHPYATTADRTGYYVSDYDYTGPRVAARRMSKTAAQELAYRLDNEFYVLSHSEHSRPTYNIVRA